MRYVMFTYVDPADAAAYERLPAAEQQADVERHMAWFRHHGGKLVGGEELDEPAKVKTIRPGRQADGVVVTDGPYVETKELLGGFIVLDVADMDEALAIARTWPSLSNQPNAIVQVQPVFVRG